MDLDEILGKIKAYADVAVDQAGKLGKAAASKTESVVSRAKIRYVINETENQIKALYTEIGEKVYQKYLENGGADDYAAEDCEKISALNAEIDELNSQLDELRVTVKCPECGATNNADNDFCSKCGAKLSGAEPEPEAEPEAEPEDAPAETDGDAPSGEN